MHREYKKINIFPFTTSFFHNSSSFDLYIKETLPKDLIIAHSYLRTPDIIVFAYQGDKSLWGYVEVKGWKPPPDANWTNSGEEWGGARWRRLYILKPFSIREFKTHVSYSVLQDKIGFGTGTIVFAPGISNEVFQKILREAGGVIDARIANAASTAA